MDKIVSHLELSKHKYNEINELQSRAYSEWKILKDHLDSTHRSLEGLSQQLMDREAKIASEEKRLRAESEDFEAMRKFVVEQLLSKEKQLEEKVSRADFEVKEKKQDLEALETLMKMKLNELEDREKLYDSIKSSVKEKNEEFENIQKSLSEATKKLDSLEKAVRERSEQAESKARELGSVQEQLKKFEETIELKEKISRDIQISIEKCNKDFESKTVVLKQCRLPIDECDREIKIKEEKLGSIQKRIAKCSEELASRRRNLDMVKNLKSTNVKSVRKSMEDFDLEFGVRERRVESLLKQIEESEKLWRVESEEGIGSARKEVDEWLEKIESNEKSFVSLKSSVVRLFEELKMRETQFKMRETQFELRRKEFESVLNVAKSVPKTVKTEPREKFQALPVCHRTCPTSKLCPNVPESIQKLIQMGEIFHAVEHIFELKLEDKLSPVSLLKDYLVDAKSWTEMVCHGLISDEAKKKVAMKEQVALRAAMECLKQHGLELPFARWSQELEMRLVYLEEMVLSFGAEADEQPKKLNSGAAFGSRGGNSGRIKIKYRTAIRSNGVVAVGPGSEHDLLPAPEIDPLASIMTRPLIVEVNTSICTILEKSTDPARFVLQYIHWFFSQPFSDMNVLRNCIILFGQLLKVSPYIHHLLRQDAMRVAFDWKANIESRGKSALDILVFLQFLETYGLVPFFNVDEILKLLMKISRDNEVSEMFCQVGIAKRIPNFIQCLIQKKNLVDAVRLICGFKLADEFDPVELLTKYMDDLKEHTTKNCKGVKRPIEEKEKITDDEITALIAIRDCVMKNSRDCSKLPLGVINTRINALEQIKIQRRRTFENKVRVDAGREERNHSPHWPRKRGPGGGFDHHQEQGRHKLPRLAL